MRYQQFSRTQTLQGQSFSLALAYGEWEYVGDEWVYEVEYGVEHRLDIISYKFYQDPQYWWIIALHNQIKDPLFDVTAGKILRVPANLDLIFERMKRGWLQPRN